MIDLFNYFTTDNISGKKCTIKWLSKNNEKLYMEILEWCDSIDCLKNLEFKRKVYHYINKLEVVPKCFCGNSVVYRRIKDGYSTYCSDKCVKKSDDYYNKWKDSISRTFDVGNEKRIKTLIDKYGVDYKKIIQNNRKSKIFNKYGVDNVFQLDIVKVNRKNTLKEKYGYENYNNVDKTRKTRIENGTQINDDIIDDFLSYKKVVVNRTETIYRNNKKLINPLNLNRSKKEYHVYHLFSIKQGFLNNIPIEIISHPCNLRMIYYKDNLVKQDDCCIDIKDLLEDIISYSNELEFKHSHLLEKYSSIKSICENILSLL